MTDLKPGWVDKMTSEQKEAKQKRLDELKVAQIKFAKSRPRYNPIPLTDNMVMYARNNKSCLEVRDIAVKIRANIRDLYDALYGRTFTHLNPLYPPWPTPEEYEKDKSVWQKYHAKRAEIKAKKKEAKRKKGKTCSGDVHPWTQSYKGMIDKGKKAWHQK